MTFASSGKSNCKQAINQNGLFIQTRSSSLAKYTYVLRARVFTNSCKAEYFKFDATETVYWSCASMIDTHTHTHICTNLNIYQVAMIYMLYCLHTIGSCCPSPNKDAPLGFLLRVTGDLLTIHQIRTKMFPSTKASAVSVQHLCLSQFPSFLCIPFLLSSYQFSINPLERRLIY